MIVRPSNTGQETSDTPENATGYRDNVIRFVAQGLYGRAWILRIVAHIE
jgi:hypothetical protein